MFGSFTVGSKLLFLVFLLTALSVADSVEYNQWPTYENSENSNQLCYECPPGFKLGQECELGAGNPGQSNCIKCPTGEFQGWSNRPRCWEKEKCGPNERLHVDGKNIAQDVCECNPNYMRKRVGGLCHEAVAKTEYSRVVNEKKVCPACPTIKPAAPCTTVEPKPCNVSIPCPPTAEPCSQESSDETDWKVVAVIGLGLFVISSAVNIFLCFYIRKGNTRKKLREPQKKNDEQRRDEKDEKDEKDKKPPGKPDVGADRNRDNGHPNQPLNQTPLSKATGDDIRPVTRPGVCTPRLNNPEASNKGVDEECTPGPEPFVPDNREGKEVDTISEDGNLLDKATPFEDEGEEVGMVSEEGDQHGKASLLPSGKVSYETERKKNSKHRTKPKTVDDVSCNKTKEQKKRELDEASGIVEDTLSDKSMDVMRQVLKLPIEEARKIESEELDGVKKIQRAFLRWREMEGECATVELLILRLRERQFNEAADRIQKVLNIPGFERKEARDQLDEDFAICERKLGRKPALHFARSALGVGQSSIYKAEKDPHTFVTNILREWKQKEGDKATSELFRQLLRNGGHSDIADKCAFPNAEGNENYNERDLLILNNT